jgi:hypothetical protein
LHHHHTAHLDGDLTVARAPVSTPHSDDDEYQQQQRYFLRVAELLLERSQQQSAAVAANSTAAAAGGGDGDDDDDDLALLTKNALNAFLRNPVALAQSPECGKRIELLFQYATAAQLRVVADAFATKLLVLAQHYGASYVLQTFLTCATCAVAAERTDAAHAGDVAALRRFAIGAVAGFVSNMEAVVANRYAAHVVAAAVRLLAGAPMSAAHVQIVRPTPIPGSEALLLWRETPTECIGAVRSLVSWFAALPDDEFARLVAQHVQTSVVLNTLLEVTSGASVRNVWGKPLWSALVEKVRVVNESGEQPLLRTGAGSLLFESILKTSADNATYEAVFQRSIEPKLVEYARDAMANHIVIAVLDTVRDRSLARNIIRSLMPHTSDLLSSVVRRPRLVRHTDKLQFSPVSARQPTPLVFSAMCAAAQRHSIVPLQERLVQLLVDFSVQAAKTTRYERALHHHFVKSKTVDEQPFKDAYTDDTPDVADDGTGGLFRGLLEFNQRSLNVKQALARATPPKESLFSLPGSSIVQTLLTFAAPHCDVVVQSMLGVADDFLLLLARDQNSFIFDRVFASPNVAPELKQQLVDKLLPSIVELAQHNVGSRVVEACFVAADIERKRAMAAALGASYDVIRATKPGSFVLRNCRVSASGTIAAGWEKQQKRVDMTRRMFADIIGDAGTAQKAAAAAAADEADDDEPLLGQPSADELAKAKAKADRKAAKKARNAQLIAAAEVGDDDDDDARAPKKARKEEEEVNAPADAEPSEKPKKPKAPKEPKEAKEPKEPKAPKKARVEEVVAEEDLEQIMADYDDFEKIVPASREPSAKPLRSEPAAAAAVAHSGKEKANPNARTRRRLKMMAAAAAGKSGDSDVPPPVQKPVVAAAVAVAGGDGDKKRKATPNARSRRRHKKLLEAGGGAAAAAKPHDEQGSRVN